MKNEINPKEVNRIARNFGLNLREHSDQIIRNSYHIEPIEVSASYVTSYLKSKTGVTHVGTADRKYKLLSFKKWQEIMEIDYIKRLGYGKEFNDCDNHAYGFAVLIGILFGINSSFVAYGDYVKGTFTGRHYWNIIPTTDKEGLNLYTYEPQRNEIVPYGDKINGAEYKLIDIKLGF